MPRFSLDRLKQASLLSALPMRIPGCVLWLDAGSLRLTSGDAVGTWTDLSGGGNHATQATAAQKPKYLEAADFLTSTEYGTLEFTAPDLITRTVGSWVTDGYNSAGRILTVSGAATAANNGKFTIESATATVLTIAELTLADEAASTTETVKTNILNGRPVVRGDSVDDRLVTPTIPLSYVSYFMVFKRLNTTGAGAFPTLFGTPSDISFRVYSDELADDTRLALSTSGGAVFGSVVPDATAQFRIGEAHYDGAVLKTYDNGTLVTNTAHSGIMDTPTTGAQVFSNGGLGIDFAEVILYNRALSNPERHRAERYLSRKYAITVS